MKIQTETTILTSRDTSFRWWTYWVEGEGPWPERLQNAPPARELGQVEDDDSCIYVPAILVIYRK